MPSSSAPPPRARAATPRQVLVFSGHMADAPDRPTPRFPAALAPAARRAIDATLASLGAGPDDLAVTQGAAGGDLLFAEACLARGVPVQLLLPLPEPLFIAQSVQPSAGDWVERYRAVRRRSALAPRVLPEELGPSDEDAFERCNRWLLDTALACGSERVHLIALWNGEGGDGPGGTAHMMSELRARGGDVIWIDTRRL